MQWPPRARPRTTPLALALVLLLLAGTSAAQVFRIPEPRSASSARAARPWLAEGRKLARTDRAAAYAHFQRAAALHPTEPRILEQLLALAPDGPARHAWAIRYAAAVVTDKGVVKPSSTARAAMPAGDPVPVALARARAAATAQLAAFTTALDRSTPSTPIVARWAADLGYVLAEGSPALRRKHAAAFNGRLEPTLPDLGPALKRLAALQDEAAQRGDLGPALEIAATLNGLVTQARFKRLAGPRPRGLGKGRNRAAEAMRELRKRLAARGGREAAPAELEKTPLAARAAFNRRHASLGNPTTTASAGGRYRIETTCGIETLVTAAKRVDACHARLAAWFGADPFQSAPGRIRIVPDAAGMERESVPAAGATDFERDGVLVVRFRWGTADDLGRVLVHALSRRFDRALHPGLPTWLAEGRAAWLAHALAPDGGAPVPVAHADFARMHAAGLDGSTTAAALKQLLQNPSDGSAATAGYALWVFLREKPFAAPLAAHLREPGAGRAARLRPFLARFADGKDGRPASLDEFAARFDDFVRAFDPRGPAAWTARFRGATARPTGPWVTNGALITHGPLITDAPTLRPCRDSGPPWFGASHARRAAAHLRQGGDHTLALTAWCHALTVDPWDSGDALALAELLFAQWDRAGAWAIRNRLAVRHGRTRLRRTRAPFEGDLDAVVALVNETRRAFRDRRKRGDPGGASRLAFAHNRIAVRLGLPRLAVTPGDDGAPVAPRRHLGALGWTPAPILGVDPRLAPAPFGTDPAGDVTVGRAPDARPTGARIGRDVFVRSRAWIARGRHVIRARIHPLTRNAEGALVLGYSRRDRFVAVSFRVRDAVGRGTSEVALEVSAGYPRERRLAGSIPRLTARFPAPRPSFLIEAWVDHHRLHLRVDGGRFHTYATPYGGPIEGAAGFLARHATSYRVEFPTVERHTGLPIDSSAGAWPRGLDLERAAAEPMAGLLNQPVRGVPRHPAGTVVLWCAPSTGPSDEDDDAAAARAERDAKRLVETVPPQVERITRELGTVAYREPLVVAVPATIHEEVREPLGRALAARGFPGVKIADHTPGDARKTAAPGDEPPRQLLFIDALGNLRAAGAIRGPKAALPAALKQWARVSAAEVGARGSRG